MASTAKMAALPQRLATALRREGEPVSTRETHTSCVFLTRDRAYKLKKPVTLPFLDYGSVEARRGMCREEVRLNRRLARDTYIGVASVWEQDGGVRIVHDDRDGALDYLVEMRRVPDEDTLEARVVRGQVSPAAVEAVARTLADFHAGASVGEADVGEIKRTYDETFRTLLEVGGDTFAADITAAARFSDAFLAAHQEELLERGERGLVRDGHGDLRAEHVVLAGGDVRVLDCIEFDSRLRQIDVAEDIAFLYMDLLRLGADELARQLIAGYREQGGDPGGLTLLSFFAAQRAWIRAKVALLRADRPAADRRRDAGSLLALARRLSWRARDRPALVVCGLAATGKSTLAAALARAGGVTVLSSDVVRKHAAGLDPSQRGGPDLYSAERSVATYDELGRLLAAELEREGGAIVDATFRHARDREAFARAAGPAARRAIFVECRVPAAVARERARERELDPARSSDAGAAEAERQLTEFEPLDEVEPDAHLHVRADRPAEQIARDVEAFLDGRI